MFDEPSGTPAQVEKPRGTLQTKIICTNTWSRGYQKNIIAQVLTKHREQDDRLETKRWKRCCFTLIRMSCFIQGLVVPSFILLEWFSLAVWTLYLSSLPLFFFSPPNYHLPLLSVFPFIHFSSQYLCSHPYLPGTLLSPSPIAFCLISPAHSFFSRSKVPLLRPLNLCVCVRTHLLFVCIYVCSMPIWVFLCVGSNIAVAILLKSPWRNKRKECALFDGQISCFSITSTLLWDSAALPGRAVTHGQMCGWMQLWLH